MTALHREQAQRIRSLEEELKTQTERNARLTLDVQKYARLMRQAYVQLGKLVSQNPSLEVDSNFLAQVERELDDTNNT